MTSILHTRMFRKLSFATLLVALAVPAGLSAQPANPDAGVAQPGQRGPN